MDIFERFQNNLAIDKFKKGEGTGPTSKIISLISLHILVLIAAILFNEEHYIPLVIFLVFGFTPLGMWISLGLVIYFIFVKYWIGLTLFTIYSFIAWFSYWFGIRNIKKNFFTSKTTINPFEGLIVLKLLTFVILALFGLAIITSGVLSIILWILYSILTFFLTIRMYSRVRAKWCQIHYPLMIRYAALAGKESGTSESEKREFEIKKPLIELIQSAYNDLETNRTERIFNDAQNKLENFLDKQDFENLLRTKNPNIDESLLNNVLNEMEKIAIKGDKGLLVRYVIAELVQNDFGDNERLEYLFASYKGDAK